MSHPNAVWTADIKGQFRTQDQCLCYPLTIVDGYSRYVLGCRAMADLTGVLVWPGFVAAFREYGLPEAIRSDNGPPFFAGIVGIRQALDFSTARRSSPPCLVGWRL